jgi:transcriptional regulator with XRE-family HTH domain
MPTKKRIGADPSESSKGFLRRLEELRGGMNHAQFADFIGLARTRYHSWRNDGATPGASAIRQIAERCNVSADWLLGIRGAAKSSTQAWDSPTLEAELSAELCRRLMLKFEGSKIVADGKELLDRLTEDEAAAMEAWEEWQEHLAHVPEILNVAAENVTYPELGKWLIAQARHLMDRQPIAPPTRPPIAKHVLGGHYTDYPGPPGVGRVRRIIPRPTTKRGKS